MAEACPAFPWQQDGSMDRSRARGGQKMFLQDSCASCHHAMSREPAVAAQGAVLGAHAAEIVVVMAEEAQPVVAAEKHLHGGAYTPDLTTLAAKIQEGTLYNNVYLTCGVIGSTMPRMLAEGVLACQELKKKIAMQFAQPYMGTSMAA